MISWLCLSNDHDHARFAVYVARVAKQRRRALGHGRGKARVSVAGVAGEDEVAVGRGIFTIG
jgi:hypothetical protein